MVKIFRVLLVTFIFICCSSYGFSMPSYTEICAQLRSVSGWSSGKCDGMNAKATPMGDMVSAQKEYLKGNKKSGGNGTVWYECHGHVGTLSKQYADRYL